MHVTEQAVQTMTELMEQCIRLISAQQRRLSRSRLAKVTNDRYDRSHTLTILISLRTIRTTPCATTLAGTREEIEINNAQMRAILIFALKSLRFRIRQRDITDRGERDTI